MKSTLMLLITLLLAFTVNAQRGGNKEKLHQEKVNYLKERLNLTADQEKEFFVIYEEYNKRRHDLRIEMSQNKLGLRKTELSDNEAKKIIDRELDIKFKMVNLEKEYVDKYYKVLSPNQIIELYKADDDFNKIMMKRLREHQGKDPRGGR
ncbi:MAG: Spy/CpxP family protein refolding chaperone [Cyclobacteriaceae bacterium]|nr:Spy/CpxP family protein refolding chaperone [Cyclobacteriaceae bacterium]